VSTHFKDMAISVGNIGSNECALDSQRGAWRRAAGVEPVPPEPFRFLSSQLWATVFDRHSSNEGNSLYRGPWEVDMMGGERGAAE